MCSRHCLTYFSCYGLLTVVYVRVDYGENMRARAQALASEYTYVKKDLEDRLSVLKVWKEVIVEMDVDA